MPDHTFDAHTLPSGRYPAQIVVMYRSTHQSILSGAQVIRYDFYTRTVNQYALLLGPFVDQVTGVGNAC